MNFKSLSNDGIPFHNSKNLMNIKIYNINVGLLQGNKSYIIKFGITLDKRNLVFECK